MLKQTIADSFNNLENLQYMGLSTACEDLDGLEDDVLDKQQEVADKVYDLAMRLVARRGAFLAMAAWGHPDCDALLLTTDQQLLAETLTDYERQWQALRAVEKNHTAAKPTNSCCDKSRGRNGLSLV